MTRILVAEDEIGISRVIERGLHAAGFTVTSVYDGASALAEVGTGRYDLMVLDIGLPDLDGLSVLEEVRRGGHDLPVIVLSAHTDTRDVVAGLDSGADDYMPKPFASEELMARIRRRLSVPAGDPASATAEESEPLHFGGLTLDRQGRHVLVGERVVDVSGRELAMLEALMLDGGQVVSRERLLSRVWGADSGPGSNVVDVYVRFLRRKVGAERIETVRGVGYRLRP